MKIITAQREFWRSLAWYQKVLVIKCMVPGVIMFKAYLKVLLVTVSIVAKVMVQ